MHPSSRDRMGGDDMMDPRLNRMNMLGEEDMEEVGVGI